ncbi:MAG: enoyl-CoA hydratase/carnithine racemase, partial [Candidatus Azotimanducaceae bacterium]
MTEPKGIKVVFEGSIVRLILDRPKQLNALNDDIR